MRKHYKDRINMSNKKYQDFNSEARGILSLKIAHQVNEDGGYGPDGQVIYLNHPFGSPAFLTVKKENTVAEFFSNGSVDFRIKVEDFAEIVILDGHFDRMDKRETHVPAQNLWISIKGQPASLMNPDLKLSPLSTGKKIVIINRPEPAIWYCGQFVTPSGETLESAVKLVLAMSNTGPVLTRHVFIKNSADRPVKGQLWTYFNLPSTMEESWDRDIWYNRGIPLSGHETVIASAVPYRDIVQIKRIMSAFSGGIQFKESTCDYLSFIGHSGVSAFLPQAVQQGKLVDYGAVDRLHRFASPTVFANRYDFDLQPFESASLFQGLLYVVDNELQKQFKDRTDVTSPAYKDMERSFIQASHFLVEQTGKDLISTVGTTLLKEGSKNNASIQFILPRNPALAAFINSALDNTRSLYNRSYGRRIADGIEVGMRDKAQDMWPMIKFDPGIVRRDLVHKFSMMYTWEHFPQTLSVPLLLPEKLHGMFPRQYPSKWLDRGKPVSNDNRPYADSALWPVISLFMYIRETGDYTILNEKTVTSALTNFDDPVHSKMVGGTGQYTVFQIVLAIFEMYIRHMNDSPYGLPQVIFGDWADPIEMMGTSIPGDATTKGKGRGTSMRLAAHIFIAMVDFIDFLRARRTGELFGGQYPLENKIDELSGVANRLRKNIVRYAWEACEQENTSGFVSFIHEFNMDGTIPDYAKVETGYTVGSMRGRDFDGIHRRELLSNAFGMEMLSVERDYLDPVPQSETKIEQILLMTDNLLSDEVLGVRLFSRPIANNRTTLKYCGRIGMVPAGCAENGEYHHAGAMMQLFRLTYPGQVDQAWKYFKPLLSVYRDKSLNGPFDMFCNSYSSDPDDPHFGAGMYFGASGTLDWTVELVERIVGLKLDLYNPDKPAITVNPCVPKELDGDLEYRRVIHCFHNGEYKIIPVQIRLKNDREKAGTWINGVKADHARLDSLAGFVEIDILIVKNEHHGFKSGKCNEC